MDLVETLTRHGQTVVLQAGISLGLPNKDLALLTRRVIEFDQVVKVKYIYFEDKKEMFQIDRRTLEMTPVVRTIPKSDEEMYRDLCKTYNVEPDQTILGHLKNFLKKGGK